MFTAALYTTAQNNLCLLMDEWIKKMSYIVCVCVCVRAYMLSCFSCVRLCDPMDCSLPGSSVHGILLAHGELEWVAVSSSRESSQYRHTSPALAGRFFTTSTT